MKSGVIFILAVSLHIEISYCFQIGSNLFQGSGVTAEEKLFSLTHPGTWFLDGYNGAKDFSNCVHTPPVCPNKNVTFWFYTRETQQYPTEVTVDRPETLRQLPFIKGAPWKILVHGYTNSRMTTPGTLLRNAYFRVGEYNIITVEFSELSRNPCYLLATLNIPTISNCTAQILDELIRMDIMPLKDLHVVALSLGTHISANIGIFMKSGEIPRITDLEPAAMVSYRPVEAIRYMPRSSSAQFVDAIHSNAGFYGLDLQVGDTDFWVNGGTEQPGCSKTLRPYNDNNACDHFISVKYYAEAIVTEGKRFWAYPCKTVRDFKSGACQPNATNQILMGPLVPLTARGNYFLTTNAHQPYAQGRTPAPNNSIYL